VLISRWFFGIAMLNSGWEIRGGLIDDGKMSRIVYKGLYEASGPVYDVLFSWIERQGVWITGPIREVYPHDPRTVSDERY
jgi:effector-binding domain-containing protein